MSNYKNKEFIYKQNEGYLFIEEALILFYYFIYFHRYHDHLIM